MKAMAMASALLWGGCLLTVGLIHFFAPTYGGVFLDVMSSVYPGFHVGHTIGEVVLGAGEGFLDGAIAGALLAWLYNGLAPRLARPAQHADART